MKTISVINHYCKRIVYFAVPNDYCHKRKSLEQIYQDASFASFDFKKTSRYAIAHNLASQ